MTENSTLDILKHAILLEKRGKPFIGQRPINPRTVM
jgi:hypothetical protein